MLKFKAQNSVIFSAIDYFTGQTAEHVTLGVPVHKRTLTILLNLAHRHRLFKHKMNSAETRQAKYELKEVRTTFIKKLIYKQTVYIIIIICICITVYM